MSLDVKLEKGTLTFKRTGEELKLVTPEHNITPPNKKSRKKLIVRSVILVSLGLIAIFFIDGGVSIITAGIIEAIKWAHKKPEVGS